MRGSGGLATALAIAIAAIAPASAQAGLVGHDGGSDPTVTYDARGLLGSDLVPEVNDLAISSTNSSVSFRERGLALVAPNPIHGLTPLQQCTFNLPSQAVCRTPEPGVFVYWSVTLGAYDDRAVIGSSALPGSVTGGGGRDVIVGSSGADVLSGGPDDDRVEGGAGNDDIDFGIQYYPSLGAADGADVLRAGDGDDVLRTNDGVRDEVDCGPGTGDRALVDSLDVTSGCESVIPLPPE